MTRAPALLGLACFVTVATSASAQLSPGARSVGMGGAGAVFASGVDAVEWNPANLAWGSGWNVSLFEAGFVGLGEGATVDEIFAIFGADLLGAGELNVAQVVNGLPADGIRVSSVTEGFLTAKITDAAEIPGPGSPLPSIGVAIGSVAVRARSRVFTDITLSKEIADLIGNGYAEENIQDYAVGNTGWSTTSLSEVTVSYGTTLGTLLSVGVGARYVKGHGMVQGRFFEPQIDLGCVVTPTPACNALTLETVAVESASGRGFGLDVGLSLDLPGGFRAAVSGTNVAQTMTWDEALVAHTAVYTDADFEADLDFIDVLDRFDAQVIDPDNVSLSVYEASRGLFEGSYFPQVFRAGVGWQVGGTTVEAAAIAVSPRGRYASAWDERLSLGVEQELSILTLRAGVARADNGISALTGGIGLGAGPVRLEASAGRFGGEGEGSPWDGFYTTIALQLVGGGS